MIAEQILSAADNVNVRSLGLFVLVLLLAICWLRHRGPGNLPPGPRPWPLIGSARCLLSGQLHLACEKWAEQYGSVTGVWIGPTLMVVLNDMEAVKEALIKQADCFSDRTSATCYDTSSKGSIIMSSGEANRERRRFGLTAMRNLGMGKRSAEHKINEEASHLLESIESQGEKPFDPDHIVFNAVSNVVCTISFGQRFEYSDPQFARLIGIVRTNLSEASFSGFGGPSHCRSDDRMRSGDRRIAEFIQGVVTEHQTTYDENDMRDVIDMLLRELEQQEHQGKVIDADSAFHKSTIWRSIYDLFVAGTDTTGNTLLWLILYMAAHPDVQAKMQEEIDSLVGGGRRPTIKDRNNMPYTQAVILEILRHRPVTPMAVPHQAAYETRLLGYTIPAQTVVLVNLWRILSDPKIWKHPKRFDPSRFLSPDGTRVEKHQAFIPFSIGRRVCMGETMARMELFIFTVNLFQRFNFSLPHDRPRPSLEGSVGVTLSPHPYEIIAKKR